MLPVAASILSLLAMRSSPVYPARVLLCVLPLRLLPVCRLTVLLYEMNSYFYCRNKCFVCKKVCQKTKSIVKSCCCQSAVEYSLRIKLPLGNIIAYGKSLFFIITILLFTCLSMVLRVRFSYNNSISTPHVSHNSVRLLFTPKYYGFC